MLCRVDRRGLVQSAQVELLENNSEAGPVDSKTTLLDGTKERCREVVAALTLSRCLEQQTDFARQIDKLTLDEAISDDSVNTAIAILRQQYPSAVEEDQFALLTGGKAKCKRQSLLEGTRCNHSHPYQFLAIRNLRVSFESVCNV